MPDRFEWLREAMGGPSLADFVADSVRRGEYDIDELARSATVAHWAWTALREVAPERAADIDPPRRQRGRDTADHVVRTATIRAEVKARLADGASLRAACRADSRRLSEVTSWTTINEVWKKRTKK